MMPDLIFRACRVCLVPGALAICLSLSPTALGTPKPEENILPRTFSEENLQKVPHRFFDKLLVNDAAAITGASKVYIAGASAGFSRYWLREHHTFVSERYKSRTLNTYARMLREELQDAFAAKPDFELVENEQDADLVIYPSISDLNIYAPDSDRFIGESLVFRAGNANLGAWVITGDDRTTALKYTDIRETRRTPSTRPVLASRVTNNRDFKLLMRRWSKRLVEDLGARAR